MIQNFKSQIECLIEIVKNKYADTVRKISNQTMHQKHCISVDGTEAIFENEKDEQRNRHVRNDEQEID